MTANSDDSQSQTDSSPADDNEVSRGCANQKRCKILFAVKIV